MVINTGFANVYGTYVQTDHNVNADSKNMEPERRRRCGPR